MATTETRTCYRHPSRETGVSCSSCGRPICPDCMTPTSVGMRCPECSAQRTRVRQLRSTPSVPRVTLTLIAVNVIAFLASGQFSLASGGQSNTLFTRGVLFGPSIRLHHEYYRLLTAGFLHLNLLHLATNMYVLYVLGTQLEPVIGSRRFATIYGVSLLGGSLGALLLSPLTPTVGASGAIFGVAGAFAVGMRARGLSIFTGGLFSIGGFLILNLALTIGLSGISIGGHIGGLIAGSICGAVFLAADRRRLPVSAAYVACLTIALACAVVAVVTAQTGGG